MLLEVLKRGTTVSAPGSCGRSANTGSFLFPETVPRPSFPELMVGVSRKGDDVKGCVEGCPTSKGLS